MRRSEYLNLATRLLAHVDNGTTDSAEDVKYIPVENYRRPGSMAARDGHYLQAAAIIAGFHLRDAGTRRLQVSRGRWRSCSYRARTRRSRAGIYRGLFASRYNAERRGQGPMRAVHLSLSRLDLRRSRCSHWSRRPAQIR